VLPCYANFADQGRGLTVIFCTEPFRIPLAGRVDVCCFDKTGTITGEDLIVEGVAGVSKSDPKSLTPVHEVNFETTITLAAAHALVLLEDAGVVGDPMEKTTLDALGWALTKGDNIGPAPPAAPKKAAPQLMIQPKKGQPVKAPEPVKEPEPKPQNPHKALVQVKRRFQFSSALKRMSTVSLVQGPDSNKKKVLAAVKGAPETLKDMFQSLPADYEKTYKGYAQKGSRVLALGYKWLDVPQEKVRGRNLLGVEWHFPALAQIAKLERSVTESDLHFAGFLVFHCPLKPDAVRTITELNASSHRVCLSRSHEQADLPAVHHDYWRQCADGRSCGARCRDRGPRRPHSRS
jgi:cation-transporting ATPase 13A1